MLLDRALITELLHDLAHRLALTGWPASIRLVGGAAIAVGYFDRRATLDIDAVYHAGDLVERVSAEIAAERGLPEDWLNNHALGFVPFVGQDEWTELFTEGPITVFVASAPMLLAMKLAANRGLRDSATSTSSRTPVLQGV
jgi:hypothetical protein